MNKWDNRQSGRTTKMMLAALRRSVETGRSVICVVPSVEDVRPTIDFLASQHYGGLSNHKLCLFKTHGGASVYIMPMRNQAVRLNTLHVSGYSDEDVFWDHDVVKQALNRILQEFHRYD